MKSAEAQNNLILINFVRRSICLPELIERQIREPKNLTRPFRRDVYPTKDILMPLRDRLEAGIAELMCGREGIASSHDELRSEQKEKVSKVEGLFEELLSLGIPPGRVRSFVSKQARQRKTQTEDMSYADPNGNYQS